MATLQQVDAKNWKHKDKQNLNELIAKAKEGADQRQAARSEFDQGEAALASNKPAEAVAHYRNVLKNDYADDGTRSKAKEQLAVATDQQRKAVGENKLGHHPAQGD